MKINEFLELINQKTGMDFKSDQIEVDLANLENWDSLLFVYMVLEMEKEKNIHLPVEKLTSCNNLKELFEIMKQCE